MGSKSRAESSLFISIWVAWLRPGVSSTPASTTTSSFLIVSTHIVLCRLWTCFQSMSLSIGRDVQSELEPFNSVNSITEKAYLFDPVLMLPVN